MTIGTDTWDRTTTSGIWKIGNWGYKYWSGQDSPRRVKLESPRTIYINRDGKSYRIRLPSVYGPKRARHKDEHPYYMEGYRLQDVKLTLKDGTTTGQKFFQENVASYVIPQHLLDANDQIKLVGRLQDLIQGSSFDSTVFLGEGKQTLDLITDTAKRIYLAIRELKRGNVLNAAHHLVDGTGRKVRRHRNLPGVAALTSASYLELMYGVVPLLQDCHDAAEALAHQLEEPLRTTYRVSVKHEVKGVNRFTGRPSEFTSSSKWTKLSRRSLIARISEHPSGMAQLGLLNPENVLWELMGWSFVIDWFIPIGSYLQVRGYASHLVGTFITTDKTVCEDFAPDFSGPYIPSGVVATKNTSVRFSRTISSSLDVPMPSFKPLGKALSWRHCINAVALVTQLALGVNWKRLGQHGYS